MRVALLVLAVGCATPDAKCDDVPYEDLSRWAPPAAEFDEVCGLPAIAVVRVEPGAARVLARRWATNSGDGLQVIGELRIVGGAGRLEAYLWDNVSGTLARSSPLDGHLDLLGVAASGETQVHLLGYAEGLGAMTFEVRDVLLAVFEWRR